MIAGQAMVFRMKNTTKKASKVQMSSPGSGISNFMIQKIYYQ
jgi:hypothetical protein